jgi:hypothetical protein
MISDYPVLFHLFRFAPSQEIAHELPTPKEHSTHSYLMSPKFCCCLPLRLGTLVITLIQFLLCGVAAGGFWYLLWRSKDDGICEFLKYIF